MPPGILFLRPAVSHSIRRNLQHEPMQERLLTAFRGAERLCIHAENSTVMVLPARARLAIFERLKRVAARHLIEVAPCACKNPDIASGCGHIAGNWPEQNG